MQSRFTGSSPFRRPLRCMSSGWMSFQIAVDQLTCHCRMMQTDFKKVNMFRGNTYASIVLLLERAVAISKGSIGVFSNSLLKDATYE